MTPDHLPASTLTPDGRAKQILVNLMIAMGTINLIASIVNDDPDYLVVHYFFFILSWVTTFLIPMPCLIFSCTRRSVLFCWHWRGPTRLRSTTGV